MVGLVISSNLVTTLLQRKPNIYNLFSFTNPIGPASPKRLPLTTSLKAICDVVILPQVIPLLK
jgi:hypothetical protein